MTIRFNAWIAAVACCVLAAPALAATDEDEDQINSYVSINGGVTKAQHACYNAFWVDPTNRCSENYSGYRLAYGHQFTPAWGVEISYGDFGYAEQNGTSALLIPGGGTAVGPYNWSLKAVGWAAYATGTLNLGKYFALFGKLGGARPEFREEFILHDAITGKAYYGVPTSGGASTHMAYGGGAQVNFTPAFALRVQYEWFGKYDVYNIYGLYGVVSPKVGLKMGSLGLVYKF